VSTFYFYGSIKNVISPDELFWHLQQQQQQQEKKIKVGKEFFKNTFFVNVSFGAFHGGSF
jgi:hypothetical protein